MHTYCKVLFVVPNLRISNGVASFAINYYKIMQDKHIHIDFALCKNIDSPYYDIVAANGSQIFILPPFKSIVKHFAFCYNLLRKEKYNIIHNNTLLFSIPLMFAAFLLRVPVRILHSHNTQLGETFWKKIRNTLFFPFLKILATDYACCSTRAAKALFGNAKCHYIPNIIPDDRFPLSLEKRKEIRTTMNVPDNSVVVGTVGRVSNQKNPLFAINVFGELLKKHPSAQYWWIGSGPMETEFLSHINKAGLGGSIHFLGNRSDIFDLLQAIDIFFLPSFFEGLPISVLEAQAFGLPCILSSSITPEVVYADLVHFISLDSPFSQWVNAFDDAFSQTRKRRLYLDDLRNSPFSQTHAKERLLEIYQSMLKHNSSSSCL